MIPLEDFTDEDEDEVFGPFFFTKCKMVHQAVILSSLPGCGFLVQYVLDFGFWFNIFYKMQNGSSRLITRLV